MQILNGPTIHPCKFYEVLLENHAERKIAEGFLHGR